MLISQGLEGHEEEEVVELEDESDKEGDPRDQTLPQLLVRLLLALAGTGVLKHGLGKAGAFGSDPVSSGFTGTVAAAKGEEYSEKESSTK